MFWEFFINGVLNLLILFGFICVIGFLVLLGFFLVYVTEKIVRTKLPNFYRNLPWN